MKNILKRLEELVINLNKKDHFWKARIKLTIFYLLGLSLVLTILSAAIYWLFSQRVGIHNLFYGGLNTAEHFAREGYNSKELIHEIKEKLLNIIILVDIVVITISSFFAYLFAKKTLAPIEAITQKQKEFNINISHELRTPLSVLKAGIEYTLTKERDITEYVTLLTEQEKEIDYLIHLSNNILETLYIKKNILNTELINISKICQQQMLIMHNYFVRNKISYEIDTKEDVYAKIDKLHIKRILYNLLKNAVIYNKENGKIKLSLSENKENIILEIEDTGIGIKKEDLSFIFDQFYKVDKTRSEYNSAGLGLYMVKEIINYYRGTITCESRIGNGTKFVIQIPKKQK